MRCAVLAAVGGGCSVEIARRYYRIAVSIGVLVLKVSNSQGLHGMSPNSRGISSEHVHLRKSVHSCGIPLSSSVEYDQNCNRTVKGPSELDVSSIKSLKYRTSCQNVEHRVKVPSVKSKYEPSLKKKSKNRISYQYQYQYVDHRVELLNVASQYHMKISNLENG